MKVSYVIPHFGRDRMLYWHLKELNNQTFNDFEVIVVIDATVEYPFAVNPQMYNFPIRIEFSGGRGPATARNIGAKVARSDIILFAGSDCIPHKELVARHYYYHTFTDAKIVQGYTPWHPDVVTGFYDFLDVSGLQAAWRNLKNDDGTWKSYISPAFCLTTNYSINKRVHLNVGGFHESFTGAAWEDVRHGYVLSRRNETAIFAPDAINFHYHRYTMDSFAKRCKMEGYHRLTICKLHPEMSWGMVNPFELRAVTEFDEYEALEYAKELEGVRYNNSINKKFKSESDDTIRELHYARMIDCCKIWSMKGVMDRIDDEHPAMQALMHIHKPEQSIEVISGVAALDTGRYGYASHCAQWFVSAAPDNWAAWAFWGEVELAMGNKDDAFYLFNKAMSINPNPDWPKEGLKRVS